MTQGTPGRAEGGILGSPAPPGPGGRGCFPPPSAVAGGTPGVSRPLHQGLRRPWHRGTMGAGERGGGGGLTPNPKLPLSPSFPPLPHAAALGSIPRSLTLASPPSRRCSPRAAPREPGHSRRHRPYVAGHREGAGARPGLREPRACALRLAGSALSRPTWQPVTARSAASALPWRGRALTWRVFFEIPALACVDWRCSGKKRAVKFPCTC